MKKIAITGPHCSGKSTVIKKIKEQLGGNTKIIFSNFSGNLSPIDYSDSNKLKSDHISEIDITYYMIVKLLERELNYEYGKEEIVVLDRCLIDQIVYPSVLLPEQYHHSIFDFLKLWLKMHPYEILFYIPKNYELLKKYGTKDKSKEYLDKIEETYLETIDNLGIKYVILPQEQEKQIEQIENYLKNVL